MRWPLLVAAMLAAPALAQDGSEVAAQRTVEGAQQFLESHFNGGGPRPAAEFMSYAKSHAEWDQPQPRFGLSGPADGDFRGVMSAKLDGVRVEGRCATAMRFNGLKRHFLTPAEGRQIDAGRSVGREFRVNGDPSVELVLDWAALRTPVQRTDRQLSISMRDQYLTITLPTDESADRVSFAMEFLRTNCEPKAAGF